MGDLSRRRAALDLRISPSHLRAAAVGLFAISGVSFGLGVIVGRDVVPPEPEAAQAFLAPVADDAVVELLARVEAAAPGSGEQDLTFPDALRGEGARLPTDATSGPAVPDAPLEVPTRAGVTPPGEVDELPRGSWTVEVVRTARGDRARALRDHLRARDLDARLSVALVAGELEYRVVAGGYRSEEGAAELLTDIEAALDDGPPGAEPVVDRL